MAKQQSPKLTPSARSKAILRAIPSDEKMQETVTTLKQHGEYAVALVGMTHLDKALGLFLQSAFAKLDKDDTARLFQPVSGTLSGTDTKIRIAYAVKLISPDFYHDLMLMNAIRNAFAHSLEIVSFRSEPVKHDCERLMALKNADAKCGITVSHAFQETIDLFIESAANFYMALRTAIIAVTDERKIITIPYREFFHDSLRGTALDLLIDT